MYGPGFNGYHIALFKVNDVFFDNKTHGPFDHQNDFFSIMAMVRYKLTMPLATFGNSVIFKQQVFDKAVQPCGRLKQVFTVLQLVWFIVLFHCFYR